MPWEMKAVLLSMLAVALAAPLGRREDWLGSISFLILFMAAATIWGLLIRGLWLNRGRSGPR
jgi:hypothetical protein